MSISTSRPTPIPTRCFPSFASRRRRRSFPAQVNAAGVTVQKSLTSPLMLIGLSSPGNKYGADFLTNYAIINLQDELTRVPGVSRVQVFGGQYAMRVWVKPDQLAKLGVTATDIINALQTQNNVNPAGKIGGEPVPSGQQFTYTVRTQGRLVTPEEFGNIVIRANPDGSVLHLRDVARVELGTQIYDLTARYNGAPAGIMAVYQLPGSNAVATAEGVNKRMKELAVNFPAGHALRHAARHHQSRHGRHSRNRADAGHRAGAGDRGGLHFPAGLAGHAHSADGRPGVADRNVHRSFPCWDFPSTRFRSSAWCWPSAWWWTTPSSWWRPSSTSSIRA